MGLLSFFKRKPATEFSSAEDVRRARTRARQRLIGATVLVGVAVIGLPLLLDTAPRPVAIDLPIEVPRKGVAAPLVSPTVQPVQRSASAPAASEPSVAAAPASRPAPRAELPAEPREDSPVAKPPVVETKPAPKSTAAAEAARAAALLEGRAATTATAATTTTAAAADGRYVVQVGAFAEASGAREARVRVEKLGLKTYTQVVETKDGKRIRVRVGPYAERAEADKAAAQLRASGLAAAVLTL